MKILASIYTFALTFLLVTAFHPFFVSVTQIDHNPETQSLEISMRIFVDDLNDGLEKHGPEKVWLGDKNEIEGADELLYKYLQNRIKIKVNAEDRDFNWVGRELEDDVCWVYVEIPEIANFASLEIDNRLLMEVFDDQTNIVHVKKGGEEKSLYLKRGDSKGRVKFE